MPRNPLVSVVIPYYKTAKFIEGAIVSVQRQGYSPLEIVLIDDGSDDDIALRIKAWGDDIRLLRLKTHQGVGAARNAGVKHARGDVIAFLDADDLWPDGKLTRQMEQLQRNAGLGIVTGPIRYQWVGIPEEPLRAQKKGMKAPVILGASVIRKWVFDRVGLFDESLPFGEDVDWTLRVHEQAIPLLAIDDIALIYQRHGANMTFNLTKEVSNLPLLLKRSLNRRKVMHGEATRLRMMNEVVDA